MAWFDDIDPLNNASVTADFETLTSYFDSPTLNDSTHTTPIYIEGSACMWWPLKKGGTNGYVGTAVISGTPSMTGRIIVGFINYPFADIDNIPITDIQLRMSSSTGFTTNFAQWDALAQLTAPKNVPISGHTPIMGYPDGATETGSPNYGSIESVGWVATTGNTNDGKQGGFDWFFVIGYLGAHSATLNGTFFSGLASEYYDNEGNGIPGETSRPIAVLSKAGDFYQTNVNFRLADGTADTANLIVTETAKTVFFANVHANHNLGYVFVDPASTHTISFTLTNCSHFWNEQDGTNPKIFTDPNYTSLFKIDGCSFVRGGAVPDPGYHATDKYIKNSAFDDCGEIGLGSSVFENNTVQTATLGAIYEGSVTNRAKNNQYLNNTTAIEIDTAQTINLDGDMFSGNTYDIENSANAVSVDSYSESNQDTEVNLNATNKRVAQTFIGSAGKLSSVQLFLRKVLSPTGNIFAKLYATSGGAPTGSALATSLPLAASDLGTFSPPAAFDFEFLDEYTLIASTTYAISVEYEDGTGTNYVVVGVDNSSPTHSGTGYLYTTSWASQSWDACFYVNRDGIMIINATNGANPSQSKTNNTGSPKGVCIIKTSVDLIVTVKDTAGDPIENVQTAIYLPGSGTSGRTELMNEDTNASGIASEVYGGTTPVEVEVRCRKASSGATKYINFSSVQTISTTGLSLNVTMIEDPNNNATT